LAGRRCHVRLTLISGIISLKKIVPDGSRAIIMTPLAKDELSSPRREGYRTSPTIRSRAHTTAPS
jgi:hypothetical protein